MCRPARTEAGYYLDIEPVAAVPTTDTTAVREAIKSAIAGGNPRVPTPTRATFPKPVVLTYANARSWADFEKTATLWGVSWDRDRYHLKGYRRRPNQGWEEDPEKLEILPPGTSLEEVAGRMCSLVQSAT
jgi:hypothetical protein